MSVSAACALDDVNSLDAVAREFGTTRHRLLVAAATGELQIRRVARGYLVSRREVAEWMARARSSNAPTV